MLNNYLETAVTEGIMKVREKADGMCNNDLLSNRIMSFSMIFSSRVVYAYLIFAKNS